MARILVTGATGLVGSALLPMFDADDEVHVIARDPSAAFARPGVRVHVADLAGSFDAADLPRTIDAVVHLAQSDNFRDFPAQARDIFDVNVAALLRLLDYARCVGATSFVSTSSGAIYGAGNVPLEESMPAASAASLGFYGATKYCGEILAEQFASFMNVAILRLFFAYGRGQRRTMLIPRLIDTVRDGRAVALQGNDGIRINPVHALDAAAACKAAIALDGVNRINVAGPETLTLRAMAEQIGKTVGRAPVFETGAGQAGSFVADTARMRRDLAAPTRRFSSHVTEML